ncbi:MAG: copper-binding protein [Phycisphaerales bacterium JB050]
MSHPTRRFASLISLCLLASSAGVMSGCPKKDTKPTIDEEQIRSELQADIWQTAEYTVRGQVVSLPTADDDLMVHHEAIPEFRKPSGTGMKTMTMPFPLGKGISLDGIEPGDKVNIAFAVDYEEGWSPIAYRVTKIEELPADTQLDFTPQPGDDE